MPLYPQALKKGDTIGIISPSSTSDPAVLVKGKAVLEQAGYKVMLHPQNECIAGHLAGTDDQRAAALHEMFADPSIDAIVCGRGGNGAIRLLERLDYDLIRRNPKLFVGYSDITVLHHALRNRCDFVTYQGPMLASFGRDYDPRTLDDFVKVLSAAGRAVDMVYDAEVLTPGQGEGVLIGGNMTMLQSILATPYGWDGQDAVLFLEDVDELVYRLDRMLHHFRYAGKLRGVRAVLIGEMVNVPDGETSFQKPGEKPYGRTIEQILRDHFPADVPLAMNVPCGHGRYLTTWPVGGRARAVVEDGKVRLSLLV